MSVSFGKKVFLSKFNLSSLVMENLRTRVRIASPRQCRLTLKSGRAACTVDGEAVRKPMTRSCR